MLSRLWSKGWGLWIVAIASVSSGAQAIDIQETLNGFTPAEQTVIEAAIEWWEMALPGDSVFKLTMNKTPLRGGTLGSTAGFTQDAANQPVEAHIDINSAPRGGGWFVDPTPHTEEEFQPGSTPHSFDAKPGMGAEDAYDLLTVVKHEIGHAIGFTTQYSSLAGQVTDPGGGAPRTYTGNDCVWTLVPPTKGTHLCPDEHPEDLLVPSIGKGKRRIQSHDDVKLLSDAFGYLLGEVGSHSAGAPEDLVPAAGSPPHPIAPVFAPTATTEIVISEVTTFSFWESEWIRLTAVGTSVYWTHLIKPVEGAPAIIKTGVASNAATSFVRLLANVSRWGVWTLTDESPPTRIEDISRISFSFKDRWNSNSFTVEGIDHVRNNSYGEIYDLVWDYFVAIGGQ